MKKFTWFTVFTLFTLFVLTPLHPPLFKGGIERGYAQDLVGEYSVGEKFAEVNIQGYTSSLIWGGKIDNKSSWIQVLSSPENIQFPTGYRFISKAETDIRYIWTIGGKTFELKPIFENRVKVWVR